MSDQVNDAYDVVVIGGGAAGLNGALQLARSRRSVLVVDAGQQRNRPAPAVHGLLGHDGRPPAELRHITDNSCQSERGTPTRNQLNLMT